MFYLVDIAGADICGGAVMNSVSSNIFETIVAIWGPFLWKYIWKIFVSPRNWLMTGGIVNGSVNPSSIVNVEQSFFIKACAALPNMMISMFPVWSSIVALSLYLQFIR